MAQEIIMDSILHTKSKSTDGSGNLEKITLPVTRWENVMGRPTVVSVNELFEANGGEYFFLNRRSISLPDSIFEACYPEFIDA